SHLDLDGWRENYAIAAERARAINAPDLTIRALNNRGHQEMRRSGPKAAAEWYAEMAQVADRYRLPFSLRWAQAVQAFMAYARGAWDDALGFADSFWAVEPGVPHYLDAQVHQVRALILLARGHDAESAAAADAALAGARRSGDVQQLGPVLSARAYCFVELGDPAGARESFSEVVALEKGSENGLDHTTAVAWAAVALGEALALDEHDLRFWARAGHAILAGRLEDAIAMLDEGGATSEAAYARLQLARRSEDPEPWLSEAEAFYRSVGATRYLAELDGLRTTRRTA
ncbi:MAG TPA: hypothetical protein VGO39_05400, partial [Gaiellaceae bacterium]|nr:hypothetical protein [Gaiellaceae bacterium]